MAKVKTRKNANGKGFVRIVVENREIYISCNSVPEGTELDIPNDDKKFGEWVSKNTRRYNGILVLNDTEALVLDKVKFETLKTNAKMAEELDW